MILMVTEKAVTVREYRFRLVQKCKNAVKCRLSTDPTPIGRGTPPPKPTPLDAFGVSAWRLRRLVPLTQKSWLRPWGLLRARRCWRVSQFSFCSMAVGGDTRCTPVVTTSEAWCTPLNCLDLVDISFHTVVPYSQSMILELSLHQRLVALLADVAWTSWEVPPDKLHGLWGFFVVMSTWSFHDSLLLRCFADGTVVNLAIKTKNFKNWPISLVSIVLQALFWVHQDVKYDFMVDLTAIGDRFVHEWRHNSFVYNLPIFWF